MTRSAPAITLALPAPSLALTARAIMETTKPRITRLVAITAGVGYVLGLAANGAIGVSAILPGLGTLAGTALCAAGANGLNQWFERDRDARMIRTAKRPMPSGRLDPALGLASATSIAFTGLCVLLASAGVVPAIVALFTILLYVLLYTPMKVITPLATPVGAIPGALPPVIGWTAASTGDPGIALVGSDALGGWLLFAIMFAWQIPHFLAIAWMHREDYARGGYRVLPLQANGPARTSRQILAWSIVLVALTLIPAWAFGQFSWVYLCAAAISGGAFLAMSVQTARTRSVRDARRMFLASVIHLPVILLTLVAATLLGV